MGVVYSDPPRIYVKSTNIDDMENWMHNGRLLKFAIDSPNVQESKHNFECVCIKTHKINY